MRRRELEHIIRAAGAVAAVDAVAVVGSQAILASHPDAPDELLASREADVYPIEKPHLADLIDGAIGEGSPFEEEFGYYAHGVGPETAVLPPGWAARTVEICNENTRGVRGVCLHAVDLAISKLAAGRDKDIEFVRGLLAHGYVSAAQIRENASGLDAPHRELVLARMRDRLGASP